MTRFLVRRDPFAAAPFNRLFENFFAPEGAAVGNGCGAACEEGTLALDVAEDGNNILVRASVPGFSKDEVNVEVHEGVLTIHAAHAEEKEEKTEKFYRRERRVGSLSRRVALPDDVVEDQIGAELKDGVLTLTMPKNPKQSPRKVKVQ